MNRDTTINLEGRDLAGVDWSGRDLTRSNLKATNLVDACLKNASLGRTNFEKAILHRANLSGAYLKSANLQNAELSDAQLQGAYLVWADLRGANCENANFENANLENALLDGANLKGANFTNIQYNKTTSWPDGFSLSKLCQSVETNDVVTMQDLAHFLELLSRYDAIHYQETLEIYLRSLRQEVREHKNEVVSPQLIALMFKRAFSRKISEDLPEISDSKTCNDLAYDYLEQTLQNQISDLNSQNLDDNWQNTTLESYLECAAAGLSDRRQPDIGEYSWQDITYILLLGQIYE